MNKKSNINVSEILKRPIVKIVAVVVIVILAVMIFSGSSKKSSSDINNLIGYQKLINYNDENQFTFVNLEGKTKKYKGYTSMSDFYYDTACASRKDEKTGIFEMAIINKNGGQVVKFGKYNSITQVVGGKFYKVENEGLYGVVDYKGKVIIEPQYSYIAIRTVQEGTECVFECQKDSTFYFVNESGKKFYETDVATYSISYANRFNSNYDTIIYISVNGQKTYFNLATGEQLFEGMSNINVSYNILNADGKVSFYDKKGKLKTELESGDGITYDARVYFKKYVIVEKRTSTASGPSSKFTVYDDEFKKVFESDSRVNAVQDVNNNIYFIINEEENVKIVNENKKEVKIPGYEYNGGASTKLQNIVLGQVSTSSRYDVFNFKGKKVQENAIEYSQKGFGVTLRLLKDDGAENVLYVDGAKPITLGENDLVYPTDYYLTIENKVDGCVSVVDKEGKIKIDKAAGSKIFYVENYIGIQNGNTINIYDVNNGKVTFTYSVEDYVNRDEIVNIIELKSGYYSFGGKKILEKK